MRKALKNEIQEQLQCLRDSCLQAIDGSWDIRGFEAEEGFEAMADGAERIASLLGLRLADYDPDLNDDYDDEEDDGGMAEDTSLRRLGVTNPTLQGTTS